MYLLIEYPQRKGLMEFEGYEENSYPVTDGTDGAFFVKAQWLLDKQPRIAIELIEEAIGEFYIKQADVKEVFDEWDKPIPFEGNMTTGDAIIQIYYNQLN